MRGLFTAWAAGIGRHLHEPLRPCLILCVVNVCEVCEHDVRTGLVFRFHCAT